MSACGVDGSEPDGGGDSHQEEENDQRPEGEVLAGGEVRGGDGLGAPSQVAVEDALDHPEHVGGGQDDAGSGQHGPADVVSDGGLHGSREDEELTDEAVEHGEAYNGECGEDEHGDDPGEASGEAAVLAHVVGAVALVEQAQEHEERGAADAFVEGLVDSTVDSGDGEGEDPEDDDRDVAKGTVCSEALEVLLDEGEEGAIDDSDGSQSEHERSDAVRLCGEKAEGEAQDGVEPELASDDHDGGGGGFRDGVREPPVQREDGDLNREGGEEGERSEPQSGAVRRDAVGGGHLGELRIVEGAGAGVEPEHGDQKDGRGDEGVEEELDGGAAAVFGASEGGDQKRHGDQGELPEGVVEEEVERDEDAEHRDLLEQEEDVEEAAAVVDDAPGDEDAQRSEQAGQNDEPHRESVHADVIADGRRGDPGGVLLELKRACGDAVVEVEGEVQGAEEGEQGDGEGAPLLDAVAVRQQSKNDGSGERDEGDDRQNVMVDVHLERASGFPYSLVQPE